MAIASNYDVVECTPVGESFERQFMWLLADDDLTTVSIDGSNRVTQWDQYAGEPEDMVAFPDYPPFLTGGTLDPDDASGHPCINFGHPDAKNNHGGSLRFSGTAFSDETDWTVVAAVKITDNSPTFPAYFVFGESTQDYYRMELGFLNPTSLTMRTGSEQLDAQVSISLDEFNIYTFRFSREDGMSIFVNLDPEPAASDPQLTGRLVGFMGASLGSSNGTDIQVASIRAFGMAVSPAQRLCLVRQMLNHYGF